MLQAKAGDTIQVHYHGTLADGSIFDSSNGREPLEFEIGSGMVIEGFDTGVTGMTIGEKKTVVIPAEKAYGAHQEEMVVEFPRNQFPPDLVPEIGLQLTMSNQSGQQFPVVIVGIDEDNVTLDANHPLAGKDLTFALELVSINGQKSLIIAP